MTDDRAAFEVVVRGARDLRNLDPVEPAMVHHRAASPVWRMHRGPSLTTPDGGRLAKSTARATNRLTAGFEYRGPARPDDARRLGVI